MTLADRPHDPFAAFLGYQLRRLSLLVMSDLAEALEALALRPAEASVLLTIGANPGMTQSDVGRILGIKRANMAPLIAGLETRAAIARAPMDGRSQALHLTEAGGALRRAALDATLSHEDRVFASLGGKERTELADRLHALWWRPDAPE